MTSPYRWSLLLAMISGLVVCGGAAATDEFRFNWPVPSKVAVDASMQKKGNALIASYTVHLQQREDAGLALRFEDFTLHSVNGVDANAPEIAARLAPLRALTQLQPTLQISAEGTYEGTAGLQALTESVMQNMPPEMDAVTRQRMAAYFHSPMMQATLQKKSGETWNVWVGAWNGIDLAAGRKIEGEVPTKVVGKTLNQAFTIEHLGPARGYACCVKLRMTTATRGPEILQLMLGMMQDLLPRLAAETGESFDPAMFTSAETVTVAEVITEAATLIPHYASMDTEITLEAGDGEHRLRADSSEYWFSWE